MKVVQMRRSRMLKLTLIALAVLLVLHFLWSMMGGGGEDELLAEHLRDTNKAAVDGVKVKRPPKRTGQIAWFSAGVRGNFEPLPETPKNEPGEQGKPHYTKPEQQNLVSQSQTEFGMNMVCSDEISMDRSIPDTRHPECPHWNYIDDLPKTSVVVVFHNEGWSTLLRTVHTVINRSPPQFLEEVLLVDDYSDKDHLKGRLEDYIRRFRGKVRLVRNKEREGLIRSRTFGATVARGEVVLFLDAHCEVNRNWLPPLLAPIRASRTTMTVPVIDGVDHTTFEYRPVYQGQQDFRGIFEWGMLYKETELPRQETNRRKYRSEPYYSPTHAGGLFAINREYFLSIGAYDPGLLVWGGENFELSFKIWQCGGAIQWVPCSRVGHVYRGFMPYNFGKLAEKKKGPIITNNYKRVIEVWFDDKYKEYFYTREPLARFLDMGDISEQLAMKKRLGCKNFEWYMQNVAYDMVEKYPELPPNLYWGEMKNLATKQCLDTMGQPAPTEMGIAFCHGFGSNQLVRLNAKGQLGIGERCVDGDRQGVRLVFCRLGAVDGPWVYEKETGLMHHKPQGRCLAVMPNANKLKLLDCDANNSFQRWNFYTITPSWLKQ